MAYVSAHFLSRDQVWKLGYTKEALMKMPIDESGNLLFVKTTTNMRDGKRFITLNCDGSHKGNVGGFGYYIIADVGENLDDPPVRHKHFGGIENCPSSLIAELYAIIYAFIDVIGRGWLEKPEIICVNTDCQPAIRILKGETSWPSKELEQEWKSLRKHFIGKKGPHFKYVKAHTEKDPPDARSHVNNTVDELAKKGRTQLEARIAEEASWPLHPLDLDKTRGPGSKAERAKEAAGRSHPVIGERKLFENTPGSGLQWHVWNGAAWRPEFAPFIGEIRTLRVDEAYRPCRWNGEEWEVVDDAPF